jgi:asparagine synthase (glutamine-hydrolysing)
MFMAGAYRYGPVQGNTDEPLSSVVSAMALMLSHRSPQHDYVEDSGICFVCNHRLPASDGLMVAYAGQFFNMEKLKAQLSLSADSLCDTVLKSAYKKWGCDFVRYIAGEFTIAIYDKIHRILLLSRDRVGLKPLYYCSDGATLIFASEVKALLKVRKRSKINYSSLHSGILFGSVYSREYLIEGIYELRAGHSLTVNVCSPYFTVIKYWDRVFNIRKRPDPAYENEFRSLINEAVKKRLPPAGIKVGISLSGGIDSTLVLGLVKEHHRGPVETYTVFAEGDRSSEFRDARLSSQHFDVEHHEISISPLEAVQSLPKIIWHMEGFSFPWFSNICLQTYFAGKLARRNKCGSIFTGNGVEHNFDGNGPQRILYKCYHNSKKMPDFVRDRLMSLLPFRWQHFLRKKCSYLLPTSIMKNMAKAYICFNSIWGSDAYLKNHYTKDFFALLGTFNAEDTLSGYLDECTAEDYFNKLLYIDFKTWNSRRNLVTNERLFGAFGIQLQIPFLDADLVEFSSSMPISIKHDFRDQKYFIRKIYAQSKMLPQKIFDKGKYNSILKFDFYKGAAWDAVSYFVNQLKARRIFKDAFIDRVLSGARECSGKGSEHFYLIELFELELWLRIFMDQSGIQEDNLTLDRLGRQPIKYYVGA